jgi:hypothetical protein
MTKKAKQDQAWPRPGTIGVLIVDQIKKGKNLEAILQLVREKYPRAKASLTPGGVGWWKQAMRSRGLRIPVTEPTRAMRKAAKKAARPFAAEQKKAA